MLRTDICRICGLPEEEHHTFEPSEPPMPAGCVCDPGEWDGEVPDPCSEYVGNGVEYCRRCEHEAACHHVLRTVCERL